MALLSASKPFLVLAPVPVVDRLALRFGELLDAEPLPRSLGVLRLGQDIAVVSFCRRELSLELLDVATRIFHASNSHAPLLTEIEAADRRPKLAEIGVGVVAPENPLDILFADIWCGLRHACILAGDRTLF